MRLLSASVRLISQERSCSSFNVLRKIFVEPASSIASRHTHQTQNTLNIQQKLRTFSIDTSRRMAKVYLTRSDYPQDGVDLLQSKCELSSWPEASVIPHNELVKNVAGIEALFCNLTDKVDAEVIEAAGSSLKVIATMSVGHEHIDLNECKKRGIRVGYTPDVLTDATADLTMALLLATSRRLIEGNRDVHNGGWKSWSPLYMCGPSIKNSTVGIVGFGRIAQEVTKRLWPFKPQRIVYSNRSDSREKEAKALGVERVTFEQLLNVSDFVILLCSLAPETRHLMNAKTLAQMKSTAILINCARGPCVEQNDLYAALSKNVIRAAGLDVTTPEPLPLDSPLLTLNNCVVVPHIGSAEIETRNEMSRITAGNILGALNNTAMISEL